MSDKEKKEIGFVAKYEGEIWMSFEDFMRTWDRIEICHLTSDYLMEEHSKSKLANLSYNSLLQVIQLF